MVERMFSIFRSPVLFDSRSSPSDGRFLILFGYPMALIIARELKFR
jgi:hypothetical protein